MKNKKKNDFKKTKILYFLFLHFSSVLLNPNFSKKRISGFIISSMLFKVFLRDSEDFWTSLIFREFSKPSLTGENKL